MKIVKYVITNDGIPLLFNTDVIHSNILNPSFSAGFAILNYASELNIFYVKCYGGSESLQVNMHKQDSIIIQNYLNNLLFKKELNTDKDLIFL